MRFASLAEGASAPPALSAGRSSIRARRSIHYSFDPAAQPRRRVTGAKRSSRRPSPTSSCIPAERGYVGCQRHYSCTRRRRARGLRSLIDRAPAPSAPPTSLWLNEGRSVMRPTPMSRASPPTSTPAFPAGKSGPARRSSSAPAARRTPSSTARSSAASARSTSSTAHAGAGAGAAGAVRASGKPAHWAALPHLFSRTGLLVNTTSLGMTGQPPLPIDLDHAAPSRRGRRPGLCPAGNATARRRPRPEGSPPPTGPACCSTRPSEDSGCGSGCGPT